MSASTAEPAVAHDAGTSTTKDAEPAPSKTTEPPAASEETAPKEATKPAAPKKKAGLFGSKRPKVSYDGPPEGKGEWFLEHALETVYDPHGTGKALKPKTILARSSEGNVRVADVVHAYAADGEGGISELAWTSPLTKYIIEAYDAC